MPYGDASKDVWTCRLTATQVLGQDLTRTIEICALTQDDLHKLGRVWITVSLYEQVVAVLEGGFAVKQLGELRPPLVLLGSSAVEPRRSLRIKPHQDEQVSVIGDPSRGAEPPLGRGTKVLHPALDGGTDCLWIGRLGPDGLSKHESLLVGTSDKSTANGQELPLMTLVRISRGFPPRPSAHGSTSCRSRR